MVRLAFISDTHTQHRKLTEALEKARADILVHSGDFTADDPSRKEMEIGEFANWCSMLRRKKIVKHVIVIAGNHDEFFDAHCPETKRCNDPGISERCRTALREAGVIYLQDSGCVVEGVAFWGTPWTGRWYDWGFQIDTAVQDEEIFGRIPSRTQANVAIDVLVTHGPPYGIRDTVKRGLHEERDEHAGSRALREAVDRVAPRIHAFGHIHPGYGMTVMPNGTLCINACSLNKPMNPPIVVELEK